MHNNSNNIAKEKHIKILCFNILIADATYALNSHIAATYPRWENYMGHNYGIRKYKHTFSVQNVVKLC